MNANTRNPEQNNLTLVIVRDVEAVYVTFYPDLAVPGAPESADRLPLRETSFRLESPIVH